MGFKLLVHLDEPLGKEMKGYLKKLLESVVEEPFLKIGIISNDGKRK